MADEFKVFEIDDSFDPLEDLHIDVDEGEDEGDGTDYQAPEFSPEDEMPLAEVEDEASVAERMEHLFVGMPGQKMRLLAAVDICRERTSLEDLDERLRAEFPSDKSVYGPARVAELLERAGALASELEETEPEAEDADGADAAAEGETAEGETAAADAADAATAAAEAAADPADAAAEDEPGEGEYLAVAPPATTYYTATEEGLALVDALMGVLPVVEAVNEQDGRYRQVYETVLRACAAEGGTTAKQLDAQLKGEPVLQDPRRYATTFLRKLEQAGALRWTDSWVATRAGREAIDQEFGKEE